MSEATQILEAIVNNFSVEKFCRFFREKSQQFVEREENYSHYNDIDFKNGLKLGEIYFQDGDCLVICAFEVKKELSERSGKKAQYQKAKDILKSTENQKYSAGIFIFYDANGNFRFSLVYPESIGTHRQWNNFRRFTYFVSREFTNKTFKQRVGDGDFSSLTKIKDTFSVEKVTNKFFEEFRVIFERTKQQFENQNKNTVCLWLKDKYSEEEYKEQINKFVYTFLGRIVFVYFLQRKGWIENQVDYIRKTLENNNNTNLYLNFFQPLFFEVFAKKESERPAEIKAQYKNTPYLNGGLFEKSELENNLQEKGIYILFDDKFIRYIILNFFENYNFTIDENSPDDQEVSIDPEMLGKVFENTLAEEERGKKGTFYTPKEVVHFMVKDTLWQFLQNETSIDKEKLHKLIYHKAEIEDLDLKKDEIRLIDDKLENIKVFDPAVGSAAFPVEMMQVLVNLRKRLNVNVGKNINEVSLKKHFIKENLYGVDIDPGAIEIAKLRLWLALIVDYQKSEAEPLPNLDFQFRVGNSLQERIDDIDIFQEEMAGQHGLYKSESEYEKMKNKMIVIKDKFYLSDNEGEKKKLKKQFDCLEHELIQAVLKNYGKQFKSQIDNVGTVVKGQKNVKVQKEIDKTINKIANLEQKIKDGTYKLFKPDFHFSEVFDRKGKDGNKIGGFDIVISNPPYGVKVEDDIKDWHGLGSKDSYGIFISTALKRFLKPGGILSYIVSDTWLTIKTHKPLREQVLAKQLHKIIRVHKDCFEATVNACIVSITNSPDNNDKLITADFTNISTRKEIEELQEKLYHLNNFIGQSTPKFAIYEYNQDLIKTNSNLPIFVGSPKLFILMNDTNCQVIEKEIGENKKRKIKARKTVFNNKTVEYLKSDTSIFNIYAGVMGAKRYFASTNNISGTKNIKNEQVYKESLSDNQKTNGIEIKNEKEPCYIRFEKGGETTFNNILLNYHQPSQYFIKWDTETVRLLKNNNQLRNLDKYFSRGIGFTSAGIYSPIFRKVDYQVFEKGLHIICQDIFNENVLVGVLASKLVRFFIKNYINHTVNTNTDDLFSLNIVLANSVYTNKIEKIVSLIIKKQKQNPHYDYMSNEQKEINKLVYDMYGLNVNDISEVETWYARRYPKLTRFCDL